MDIRLISLERPNHCGNTMVIAEFSSIREANPAEFIHFKQDDESKCSKCGQHSPSIWTDREEYWGTILRNCKFQGKA